MHITEKLYTFIPGRGEMDVEQGKADLTPNIISPSEPVTFRCTVRDQSGEIVDLTSTEEASGTFPQVTYKLYQKWDLTEELRKETPHPDIDVSEAANGIFTIKLTNGDTSNLDRYDYEYGSELILTTTWGETWHDLSNLNLKTEIV